MAIFCHWPVPPKLETQLWGYFYVAVLLHKQERWDGLINEAIDGSELGAAVKKRGIDLGLDAVLNRQGGFSFEMASGFDFESTGGLARTDLDSRNVWMVCYIIKKQLFKADVRAISSSARIKRR